MTRIIKGKPGVSKYIDEFPIPEKVLPPILRALLEPVGLAPDLRVEITTRYDFDHYGPAREYVHMLMAVVREPEKLALSQIGEAGDGVVYASRPDVRDAGGLEQFAPSVSGHEYLVASNGGGSFFGFQLAEKVMIALGLTPRAFGGTHQKLSYDDLHAPEFGIAEGEASTEYYFTSKRDVHWTMTNAHLRRYLWMRGAHGVRIFFYEKQFNDIPDLRKLMNGKSHVDLKEDGGWCEVDIREFQGGLLVQVWAVVAAVTPELCPEPTADELEWPGFPGPMTHHRANGLIHMDPVYFDDRFLEHYEQNSLFDTMPVSRSGQWLCGPSYQGQWGFSDFVRVGRNLIRAPLREVYKGVYDREIIRAHAHVLTAAKAAEFDHNEEHVVAKTARLANQLLDLGDNLAALAAAVGLPQSADKIVDLSREAIRKNQWRDYPALTRLAQVAPLTMTEQAFLARCKSIHEFWQRIPNSFLKDLLEKSGQKRDDVKPLASAKLLQGLTNTLERLNKNGERADAFEGSADPLDLTDRNASVAALFKTNDLRIADAHNAGGALKHLEDMGFDIAGVNQGYGRALDHVFDSVINAFQQVNDQLDALLNR
jgi:hypothetical protein